MNRFIITISGWLLLTVACQAAQYQVFYYLPVKQILPTRMQWPENACAATRCKVFWQ
jgi:hypothetical protein